jgi:hypothetical protein
MIPRRNASLLLGLLLAGATLAGCRPAGTGEQPPPSTQAPRPTSGSPTPAGGCGQVLSGAGRSPEGPGTRRFEITRQQLAVISSHLIEVFCDQGLWQQDVGFGFNYEQDPNRVFVLINPGRSGLTAKQVLDRLLGRG